jgi:hypothetical protein
MWLNVSKETTWRELSKIQGLDYWEQRAVSLNLTAPATNAMEICRTAMNFPSMDEMLEEFLTDG